MLIIKPLFAMIRFGTGWIVAQLLDRTVRHQFVAEHARFLTRHTKWAATGPTALSAPANA
jgi:hypothetical protein